MLEYGIFPAAQFINRGKFWSKAREFRKLQWLPQVELERRQMERFRRIVAHANENVPFYRKRFKEEGFSPDELRTNDDISRIPILKKEEIRKNFSQMVATNIKSERWKLDSTSGSSGEPLIFYRDSATDDLKVASDIMMNTWCGIEPGDRILWITHPRQIKVKNVTDYVVRLLWNNATDLRWMSVNGLQEESAEAIVRFIDKIKPRCLYGYASGLLMLAKCFDKRKSHPNYVRAIISSSETLSSFSKKILEETFDCDTFNRYGLRELGGSVAQDCQKHNGLHVNSELYSMEAVKNGQLVSPRVRGQLVVTDLNNMVMPFIRYQTGDLALYDEPSCSCERGFPTISEIVGRETEFINIRTPSGKIITHPGYFLVLGDFVKDIKNFQFVQERLDELTLKIVPSGNLDLATSEKIRKFMNYYFGTEVKVTLEIVEEIPPEASGKRPIVKSKIPFEPS